jgi:hypothetical protein
MPAYAFIILAEMALMFLVRVIAPGADYQKAIAHHREPPQLLLVPLIARPGLPHRIIARPAIVRLQLLDIAPPAGRMQALRARRPGRSQAVRAVPGQQETPEKWICDQRLARHTVFLTHSAHCTVDSGTKERPERLP